MDQEYAADTLAELPLDLPDALAGMTPLGEPPPLAPAIAPPAAPPALAPALAPPRPAAFCHVDIAVRRNQQTGGQTVTHTIEVAGPRADCDRFVASYRDETLPANAGQKDRVSRIPPSVAWRAGQLLEITQELRLPAATYAVSVALFNSRNRQRVALPGRPDGTLPIGSVAITLEAQETLVAPRPMLPADPDRLLDEVLAMPAMRDSDARDNLTYCFGQAPRFGHVLEFGVASGRTINHLASLAPERPVWGFDTFEGLPEAWVRSKQRAVPQGTFSSGGRFPFVHDNVRLVPGLIQHTLPEWLAQNPGKLSLVHVDVDLYSSAKAVLELLNARIVPGTVIVFDDVADWRALHRGSAGSYDNWREGEWKALLEWTRRHARRFALVSRLEKSVLAIRVLE